MVVRSPTTGTAKFYSDRADEARSQANAATLDNVRERCLRSATVWEELASRAARVDAERRVREAATASTKEWADSAGE